MEHFYIVVLLLLEGHHFPRASEALHSHCGGGGGPGRRHSALREKSVQENPHSR